MPCGSWEYGNEAPRASRSPIATSLLEDFRRALPDFRLRQRGSPYCVRRYVVDRTLGGPAGLAVARRELAKRGMRLVLILCRTMWRRTIHG